MNNQLSNTYLSPHSTRGFVLRFHFQNAFFLILRPMRCSERKWFHQQKDLGTVMYWLACLLWGSEIRVSRKFLKWSIHIPWLHIGFLVPSLYLTCPCVEGASCSSLQASSLIFTSSWNCFFLSPIHFPALNHHPHAIYFTALACLLFLLPWDYKPRRAEVSVCYFLIS